MSANPEIVSTPGVNSGKPRIAATRVRVQDVVYYHQRAGWSVEKISEAFKLSLEQVQAALVYYAQHQAEIDQDMSQDEEFARQVAGQSATAKRRIKARLTGR
jgi:uncharacterized protein (DUF433 family)